MSKHGDKFIALPMPSSLGPALKKARVATIDDDGDWTLGRIKKVNSASVHKIDGAATATTAATKHTYQWKSSNTKVEYPKLKLRRRQYGTHWVAFDKKPKH